MKRASLIEWALKWASEGTIRLHDVTIAVQGAAYAIHSAVYLEWHRRNMERCHGGRPLHSSVYTRWHKRSMERRRGEGNP